jgi:hypothetical protein
VKVDDCCDLSSLGTLTCVKMIEICVDNAFATVCIRFIVVDHLFCFGEDG